MSQLPIRLNADGLVDSVYVVAADVRAASGGIVLVDVTDSDLMGKNDATSLPPTLRRFKLEELFQAMHQRDQNSQ